jgi:hypothetical protein
MKKWIGFIVLVLLCSTTALAQDTIWQPEPGTSWQWQLNDETPGRQPGVC